MGEEFLGSSTAIDSSNIGFQVFEYNFVVFFFCLNCLFMQNFEMFIQGFDCFCSF